MVLCKIQPILITNKKLTKKEYNELLKKFNKFGTTDDNSESPKRKRPSSPTTEKIKKTKRNYYVIFDFEDEDEKIQEILDNPESKNFDIVSYQGSAQGNTRTARIITDSQGNKKLGHWVYPDDDY